MALEGHHPWCKSTVPAPWASCCRLDYVEAGEKLVMDDNLELHESEYHYVLTPQGRKVAIQIQRMFWGGASVHDVARYFNMSDAEVNTLYGIAQFEGVIVD